MQGISNMCGFHPPTNHPGTIMVQIPIHHKMSSHAYKPDTPKKCKNLVVAIRMKDN